MAKARTSGIRRLNRVKGTVYGIRFRDGEAQRSRKPQGPRVKLGKGRPPSACSV